MYLSRFSQKSDFSTKSQDFKFLKKIRACARMRAHARISCFLQEHAAKTFKDEKKSLPQIIFPQYFLSLISLT